MFPLNYIYIAVAIAFAGMVGVIGYQNNKIEDLEKMNVLYAAKNDELVTDIMNQNLALRDGEEKFVGVQKMLDIAAGKNIALTKQYNDLRNSWKETPPPKDCPSAIIELHDRAHSISKEWNTK